MKIAFYAPLKSPLHPVPSGDRLMARLLIAALERGGHEVELMSGLRSFAPRPEAAAYAAIEAEAQIETERISGRWRTGNRPDIWFTYHPYYKAPDLLGPVLAPKFGLPYVTAETSYSERRNIGEWARLQSSVLAGIDLAAVNICFTNRDRAGIASAAPRASVAMLRPFLDVAPFQRSPPPGPDRSRMITVAMMRPGDKMKSYQLLAEALARLPPTLPWTLSIVGDGPMKAEVAALFAPFVAARITWHGEATTARIAELMSQSALYVWPGYGEAYGLAYLEAQAAGLPVVALNVAGVPEAVVDGVTGFLTEPDDPDAYARCIERLLRDGGAQEQMGAAARGFVLEGRTLDRAARQLDKILTDLMDRTP